MRFEKFSKQVFHAFDPREFNKLINAPFWDSVKYFTKILAIAYIIMAILLVPKLVTLKSEIQDQLSKFDSFSVTGIVSQSESIRIPAKEPLIVIDATGSEVIPNKERITITRDSLFYKFFAGRKEIPLNQIKQMDKPVVSRLIIYFFIFILPSLVFFTFGSFWLKYFLFAVLIGTIVFLMADLTRFSQPWKTCVKSAYYTSTLIILVEVVSSAIYAKWMVSLFSFWNLNIYLVPLVAWLILSITFVSLLHFSKLKRKHSKD
ncbi:DUF1189 family protein [Candidatus Woesearchaeota archaeon]|nr:DUF1189 family protein [Candidatus Woesearchaeota archaeon]